MERREQQIEVRAAKFEDLERLCEIYSESFSDTEPMVKHWWKILEDPNIHYLVVVDGEKMLGVASIVTINKILRSGSRMGLIEDVAVASEARGLGLGKLLIESLLALGEELGCYKVVLNCSDANIAFYEKCGMYKAENQMRWDRPKKQN
jgi:ribosomal protein S18 acetylase RimI-like enzyme